MLIAFENCTVTKEALLKQLEEHAEADELIKGQYWDGGKGCAVGCTIHGDNHSEYEPRFGIPEMLAHLEDRIFEGLPNIKAKTWPIRFIHAVKPGTDLSLVGWSFLHWLLIDEKVNPGIGDPLVREAVNQCTDALRPLTKGEPLDREAAERAVTNAYAVGARLRPGNVTTWAVYAAAWAAVAAVRMADDAECSVSYAKSAARAVGARLAPTNEPYVLMSEKLIALIEAAPKATV